MDKQTKYTCMPPVYTPSSSISHHYKLHCLKIGLFCLWDDFVYFGNDGQRGGNGQKVLRFLIKWAMSDISVGSLGLQHSFCNVGAA